VVGGYNSTSELVRDALDLLAKRDPLRDSRCTALLDDGYRAMAAYQVREAEARKWCNRPANRCCFFATLDADDVPADFRERRKGYAKGSTLAISGGPDHRVIHDRQPRGQGPQLRTLEGAESHRGRGAAVRKAARRRSGGCSQLRVREHALPDWAGNDHLILIGV
jgi:hypothetical protein